jgi:DNA-binding GntR family transcriptional regulator
MTSADSQNSAAQTIERVHEQLRTAILRGDLGANETISQVKLARDLGISRTPLREVLRMLQREGLVIPQANRRLHIAGVSLADLEQVYAMRLPLEALAIRFSVPQLEIAEIARLEGTMAEMAHFASVEEWDRWESVHREFHSLLTCKCGTRISDHLRDLFDHSSRYRRLYTLARPSSTWSIGTVEHRAILDAAKAGDVDRAAVNLVNHLARTPLTLFSENDPTYEPRLIRDALRMLVETDSLAAISGESEKASSLSDGAPADQVNRATIQDTC